MAQWSDHLVYALAWLSFGLAHSLLAREGVKTRLGRLTGPAYRLLYNAVALVHLLAVVVIGEWLIDPVVFARPTWLLWAQGLVGVLGAAVLVKAMGEYDLARFSGSHQMRAGIAPGDPEEDETLKIHGLHRYLRHPLYAGAILLLLAFIGDTLSLATALWAILYFVIGSRFEERALIRRFGKPYADYRKQVPALIPWRGRAL